MFTLKGPRQISAEDNRTRLATPRLKRAIAFLCFTVVAMYFGSTSTQAAVPPAGTTIGNQASATYTDASDTQRTTTSNVAITVVQQVASLILTADGTNNVSPGGQVTFPHTLTNTGNGTDTFDLSAVNAGGDNFDLTSLAIYADENGDGIPDNSSAIISSGPLAAGTSFKFVVAGIAPSSQTEGQISLVTVTATSVFDNGETETNTDTAIVSNNAVIRVTKSIDSHSGSSPSGPYTTRLPIIIPEITPPRI